MPKREGSYRPHDFNCFLATSTCVASACACAIAEKHGWAAVFVILAFIAEWRSDAEA